MPLVAPDNESLIDSLTPEGKKRYAWLRRGAQDTLAAHPEMNSDVLTLYLHDYLQQETSGAIKTGNFNADNSQRIQRKKLHPGELDLSTGSTTLDPRDLEFDLIKARRDFDFGFYKNNVEHADLDTQKTWKAYVRHMEGPSLIGGAVHQFYDSEKGGMQWGGLAGAALGGIAGYKLIAASGGGWFGLAVGALATLVGAWLGNQATDMITGAIQRSKDAPKAAPETPAKAQSKAADEPQKPASDLHQEVKDNAKEAVKGIAGQGTLADAPDGPAGQTVPKAKPAQAPGQSNNPINQGAAPGAH